MLFVLSIFQRIGFYSQHSADQLNLEESSVEYLQVDKLSFYCDATDHDDDDDVSNHTIDYASKMHD